jgi:methylase of polypeptide subunit release factors
MTEENRAWAAGERIEVIRRFAAQAGGHLKPGGRILFVASSLTGLHEVVQIFTWRGFNVRILKERKIPWETLFLAQAEFIRRPKE